MGQNWEDDFVEYPEQCPCCGGDTLNLRTQDWLVPEHPGFCSESHALSYYAAERLADMMACEAQASQMRAESAMFQKKG